MMTEALARDREGREKAEMEVRKLNDDLRNHVVQLEESNKELDAFSYSVSHDLRSPLRSIDGFSLALLEDYGNKLDSDGRDYLERVRGATQRMSQLIDDLLKLSRIARFEMKRERVDLGSLANTIAQRLRQNHPERSVNFVMADGLIAYGDERLLTIALENLFANAWKFSETRPGTVIELGAILQSGTVVYFVKDNGVGFDMAYADKLFNPFQRLHRQAEFAGTGIGLATVKRIINRHRGRVWIESKMNEGTTVFFTLA
jgi:light-regulated signal transduction histidine kinase (bacteriophytochrome)